MKWQAITSFASVSAKMIRDSRMITQRVKSGLSVLIVATIFVGLYFIRCDPFENNYIITISIYIINFLVVIVLSCFSFYHHVDLKVLFLALLGAVVLRYFLPLPQNIVSTAFVVVLTGIIYSLNMAVMAGIFTLLSAKLLRHIIFLGVALATLLLPIFHALTDYSDPEIQQLCFTVAVGAMAIVFALEKREKKETLSFPPAQEVFSKYRGVHKQWKKVLFTQRRSTLFTFIMMIPFFFCLGIFEAYSFEKGFSFASSDVIMIGSFAVIAVLFIADILKPTNSWFSMICFVVGAAYMVIIFSTLIVVDFPPYLFGIMRAGIFIMQMQVLILLAEMVFEESISPIFLYGALAIVLLLPLILGNSVALLLSDLESSALVGGALMAIAIVAGIIAALFVRKPGLAVDEEELGGCEAETQNHEGKKRLPESFTTFCDAYGITAKEKEVIALYSQGRSVRFICSKLYIADSTARTYIQRVYTKLAVHNKQELLDLIEESASGAINNKA